MLIAVPSLTSRAIAAFLATVGWTVASQADPVSVRVPLSGMEELPPVQTAGSGVAEFIYDPETRTVKWVVTYNGLSGPATMAHFHGPATQGTKGPVVVWLSKQGSPADSPLTGQTILTPEQAVQFADGLWYVNVHTQANPGGRDSRSGNPPQELSCRAYSSPAGSLVFLSALKLEEKPLYGSCH